MKKIYSYAIIPADSYYEKTGEITYEVDEEENECEYSEEWCKDSDDPIKDYVENAVENAQGKTLEELGYSWDNKVNDINFKTVNFTGSYHILYDENGTPVELYVIKECDDEE